MGTVGFSAQNTLYQQTPRCPETNSAKAGGRVFAAVRALPADGISHAAGLGLLCNRKLFAQVDYCLLGTFVCFFVFVGNIARIEPVQEFFADIMLGRELWISAALSQCISNVPAAVMLSGFTRNAKALLLGVNLGGLGTPIASLASLISYQFYSKAKRPKPLKYLAVFSAVNFGMLAFLLLIGWLQLGHSISL